MSAINRNPFLLEDFLLVIYIPQKNLEIFPKEFNVNEKQYFFHKFVIKWIVCGIANADVVWPIGWPDIIGQNTAYTCWKW